MDHVRDGETMLDTGQTSNNLEYIICKSFWWDYVIEVGKCKTQMCPRVTQGNFR